VTRTDSARLVDVELLEPCPRTTVVAVHGGLDDGGAAALATVIDKRLAGSAPGRLVLDLREVTRLGTAALSLLLRLHRRCRIQDVHLVLVGTSRPAVNQPLRVSGLLSLFDTRPSVAAATRGPRAAPQRSPGSQPETGPGRLRA
jgi:anti-anti-sigma factor